MPEPSPLPLLDSLRGRVFSFYPAIRNVEFNEWTCGRETWSEILVVNSRSGQEIWIPRNYWGGVSSAEEPVLIVGLERELELKAGAVWPYQRAVIEMPAPPRGGQRQAPASEGKPPSSAASPTESKVGRLILYAVLMGFGICLLVVVFASQGPRRPRDWFRKTDIATKDQKYLSLTRDDGYQQVALALGPPDRDQWISPDSATVHFQLLWYSPRSYIVVLMGAHRSEVRYIGAIHAASRAPLDSVPLPGGGTTTAMLRNLPKF